MGGVKETESHHFIILENLEKDLSPVLMKDFIYEQASIATHTYVFQSLSIEPYARGVIIVDSKQKLKRMHEFISNPNHFIISTFSGRPWVIAEDMLRAETFNIMQILQPKSEVCSLPLAANREKNGGGREKASDGANFFR